MKIDSVAVLLKYYNGELNPFDQSALECALYTGFKVSVLAMAPISVKPQLESITRLGADAILVSDNLYAGSDTLATSFVLSKALQKLKPDVIFCGRQSVDGDTAQVPPMLAKRLGYGIVPKIIEFDGLSYKTRNGKVGYIEKNCIYTFERIKALRFPSIFSKTKEVKVISNKELMLNSDEVGVKGSPTQVVKTYQSQVGRRFCKFIDVKDLGKIISESLNRKVEHFDKGKENSELLDEVFYFGDVKDKAESIAKKAVKLVYENKTADIIVRELKELDAKTVLFSDDEKLKFLASELAVLTNSGLAADCTSLSVQDQKLIMTRPARGGDITADIICKSDMTLSTLRTTNKKGADVIFSIGKGAIPYANKIKSWAKKYDAEVCASRSVVDSGTMPYQSQVGLTGKSVAPKVYVAFGISGAVQHTCAISNAGTVIAVNVDKNAGIFDYSDYGVKGDLQDVEL